ncbi:helix-turn-helix transcriptional regulator [Frateuria sp. Soil773]|uniref:helix-turn-helix transcriptional regulator n=1 Tax=Frateuria sp. Soil773 TaxID=1736407 RepID=UPI0009E7D622|nr:helix-turn-helix transcriptional regulator [Frateuria sp. Soil773]
MTAPTGKPRGVLRQRLGAGAFQHDRRAPSPALAGLVEHYWQVGWDLRGLPPQTQETLPHPNVHLVVESGRADVYGVHTGRFTRVLAGQDRVFGIKFRAGAFQPFLRAPVSTLLNRSMRMTEAFGAGEERFARDILACPDIDAMAAVAERMLLRHRPAPDPEVERIGALVADLVADRSLTTVERVASRHGLGVRALQRLFRHYVGVGPKWVIGRYRLHEAVAQLQAGKPIAWTGLALELGYFDQAHFIRDFRALVGRSPADYMRAENTAAMQELARASRPKPRSAAR